MREKIILAPGCNGNELLRSLAARGINCINLRIVSAYQLAHMALMRSGITIDQDFVSRNEEYAVISRAAKAEEYFEDMCYADTVQLANAIRTARCQVTQANEVETVSSILRGGVFKEKNNAIANVYEAYMTELHNDNKIDSVMLIKKAMNECKPLNADICVMLEDYPLNAVERLLASKLAGDGKIQKTSLAELFKVNEDSPIHIQNYYSCFGSPNEVDNILSIIYKGIPLDKCVVAVTNANIYSQLFFDNSLLHNIPMTFGTGIPISNSNPAKLLKMYYQWMTDSMFDGKALIEIIDNSVFDKSKLLESLPKPDGFSQKQFFESLKDLRLTNREDSNKSILAGFEEALNGEEKLMGFEGAKALRDVQKKKAILPALKAMSNEICAPCEVFVTRYARIRKKSDTFADKLLLKLDLAASDKIYDELSAVRASGIEQTDEDIIKNLLRTTVCSGHAEPGALHITSTEGALVSIRDNLFVAGLAASMFPGSPKENYLLLDADLDLFGDAAAYLRSTFKVEEKKNKLNTLVSIVSALNGNIYISYPARDVSELKKNNASSSVFEIYQKETGSNVTVSDLEKKVLNVEYFEPKISLSNTIGETYLSGKKIEQIKKELIDGSYKCTPDKSYSPSVLSTFFSCPKHFVLNNILGIPDPEIVYKDQIISAADVGTLAHTLMEILGENRDMTLDRFLEISGELYDLFMLEHPPIVQYSVEGKKDDFLLMMNTAFSMETQNEIFLKEEDIECEHECGIKIHGFPDRVEKLDDGTYCVVDFKTGREKEHIDDDPVSCFQALIYAYILEKTKNICVSRVEFRYLRLGEVVSCRYTDDAKTVLNLMLGEFVTEMSNGFPKMVAKLDEVRKEKEKIENGIEDETPLGEIESADEESASDEVQTPLVDDSDSNDDDSDGVSEKNPCKYCKFGLVCGMK